MAASNSEAGEPDAQLPPLTALVVVCFHPRRGNSITWQKVNGGCDTTGFEFKALPSGLHTVKSDLIYFVHNERAGISAFVNTPDALAKRGASFYAVAALTSRAGGRLGKVWLHAPQLERLAADLVAATDDPAALEQGSDEARIGAKAARALDEYWERYQQSQASNDEPPSTPNAQRENVQNPHHRRRRSRAASELMPMTAAPDSHPVNTVSLFLDTFGPLLYPLQRCALLRKRILFVRKPPIKELCHFVYLLSIFSSLPTGIVESLPISQMQHETLFTVGVTDIADLETRRKQPERPSWIACSSDELLATKSHLYDIKVELAPPTDDETSSPWPTITTNDGTPIKATQRDLRHYKALRTYMNALYKPNDSLETYHDEYDSNDAASNEVENAHLLPHAQSDTPGADPATYPVDSESDLAEPQPWAAIAYDSFIWWASAGERDADFQEERDFDQDLLDAVFSERAESPTPRRRSSGMSMSGRSNASQSFETGLVAYFHRVTGCMLGRLGEVLPLDRDSSIGQEQEGGLTEGEASAFVSKDDLIKMGLDVWSKSDRTFVQQLARTYFGAEVEVQGKSVDCCGVRIY